jgi:hypothetical protein
MSARSRLWTDDRWRSRSAIRILTMSGNATTQGTPTVELSNERGTGTDAHLDARLRAEQIANELAMLVAHEHRRAEDEQARREAAEAAASELAKLLATEHADLERERVARAQAEAQARELAALTSEEPGSRRFANVHRSAPRTGRPPLQRAL